MEESLGRYLIPFLSNEALISSGNSPLTDTAYIPGWNRALKFNLNIIIDYYFEIEIEKKNK